MKHWEGQIARRWAAERGRRHCTALLLLASSLGTAPTARAGDFPLTAYASSHSTRPEYVDPASLIFLFPQRGGITESQIMAFNLGSSTRGLGAVGNWRGQGFFLLSQQTALGQGTSLFQAGWGGSWSPLRVGLAGRASRQEESSTRIEVRDENGQIDYDGAELNLYEGSFGIGFGGDDVDVELVAEMSRIDSKLSYLYLRKDTRPSYSDTTAVYLESDDDYGFGTVARVRGRFGGGVEIIAVGRWGGLRNNYDGFEYVGSRLASVQVERELESWSAGLSVSFPLRRLDWLGMTAHFQHLEDLSSYSSSRSVETTMSELASLSFALRQQLWRDLWGQAGATLAYSKADRERQDISGSGLRRETLYSRTDFRQDFSWGLSYVWRNFDLRAAMRETLPVTSLFFALDVTVRP